MEKIITIEEAIEVAKERNHKLNRYQEYTDAYYFFRDYGDGVERIGSADSGFVMLKKDGTIVPTYIYFLNPDSDADEIGEEKAIPS